MYLPFYFAAVAIACMAILLRPPFVLEKHYPLLRSIALCIVILVYFLGMSRDAGVDIENYRYAYEVDHEFIPDVGFQFLATIAYDAGVPFRLFILLIGFVSAWALSRIAKFYELDLFLLFLLYFVHLIVVRDLATLRVGLAVAVAVIGMTSGGAVRKWALYAAATSIHSSVFAFVVLYEFCIRVSAFRAGRRRLVIAFTFVAIVALGMQVAGLVALVDERIDIYSGWQQSGYGSPVESYLGLMRSLLLLAWAWAMRDKWKGDAHLRAIVYLELFSVAVFLGFWQVAIFAFRLSNVVSTLYPVLILALILRSSAAVTPARLGLAGRAAMIAVVIGLVSRPGTLDILKRVNEIGF